MLKRITALVALVGFLGVAATSQMSHQALASATVKYFTIIHTNDEHSMLLPAPLSDYHPDIADASVGGFARLARVVSDVRIAKQQQDEPVLLISGGDFLGGSPFAWMALDGKAPELGLMQQMGYDVVAIGNHEYDFGPEVLAKYFIAAGYPGSNSPTALLATNTVIPAGHELLNTGIKGTHIKILENGLAVGFFSIIGKDAIEVSPLVGPVQFSEQIASAKEAVAELTRQGAQVIVAVNHAGVDEDKKLAKAVPGIHVIVGGHCHTALTEPIVEGGTIIVQTGAYTKNVGILELAFDLSSGKLTMRNQMTGQRFLVPLDDKVLPDPVMAGEVERLTQELNSYVSRLTNGRFTNVYEVILKSKFVVSNSPELKESAFGNFVTDAMRQIGERATGEKVHFAIQANGVIRGSIKPGTSAHSEGEVVFMDLASIIGLGSGPDNLPGYPLVHLYLTGEEVRRVLEVGALLAELKGDDYFLQYSGLRLTYDPARAVIARIPVKGTPIPSTRAVLKAERYLGSGFQDDDNYVPLLRGDKELYHVVTDYYLVQFLPMVGDLLPSLALVLKDKNGNPILDIKDTIIYRDGRELKVWQAVVEYATDLPNAVMPDYYRGAANRIVEQKTLPLIIYPLGGLAVLIAVSIAVVRCRRTLRMSQDSAN
ncbi:MAG: bifunctional UDP-sugar hydrolase/5'-nucleotidase [Bacillota bacterium]|nr:bifunctional UDP-sugar hydrolase/5'-nucleotidase [Bacillota bacterium]